MTPIDQNSINALVTTDWLSHHLKDPDLVVLDCTVLVEPGGEKGFRNVSGREAYNNGHIPSAGFADLLTDLSDTKSDIEFAMPSPEQFCSVMGALGVGNNSRVVLYDDWMGWAARVWWMLRWVGFDRVAILDGGSKAWIAEGKPLSITPATRSAKELTPTLRPELIADHDEVLAAIDANTVSLIDTMPEEHYRGEQILYGRPGHIPGASNVSIFKLFEESGHYRPLAELASLFDLDRNTRTITYCGGGIAASAVAFVLIQLGFTDVAVYTASLQEWAADPANPMAVELERIDSNPEINI